MLNQLMTIAHFIFEAFLNIWPYLLITIPIAVAVNMSGASQYITRAFQARPLAAIVLATAVGAFSPFCSCSVIPVVATLLIGGVPLAPVMAFWIASPSMDPEIFFLSVATLGWHLAVWRLIATLVLSLSAGFLTHLVVARGWLGGKILRDHYSAEVKSTRTLLQAGWQKLQSGWRSRVNIPAAALAAESRAIAPAAAISYTSTAGALEPAAPASSCAVPPPSFRQRLLQETWAATLMVVKFMALAFFLEALITLYVPSEWIAGLLGHQNPWAIATAALLGIPVYTSNLAALPMVGGLLTQGMNPAAALAFLIAGPTTTLPAMAAVWGLVSKRVFALYVMISLAGAVLLGYAYALSNGA